MWVPARGVLGTGFWNGASALNQYFVLPKNGSKYYLKYTFLTFPVLGILGLGTPLEGDTGLYAAKYTLGCAMCILLAAL